MSEYIINTKVDIHDVDYNGIARASSVLKYMQSAAEEQLCANGMSYDVLYNKYRKAFILSRLRLEIDEPLKANTPIRAITYPCESRGYTFLRCHRLESDGRTVARALSVWALLDTDSRALVRVEDFSLGLDTLPAPNNPPDRFRLPSVMNAVGSYGVHYSDVDQNRHMNNTRYPDMYSSFIDMTGKYIRSITLNYRAEAMLGEKLRVERAVEESGYLFRTVRSDGQINSEAQIVLDDIG